MQDISIRLYFRDAPPPGDIFCTVAQALAQWEAGRSIFGGLKVDRETGGNRVVEKGGELTLEELLRAARGLNDPVYDLHTTAYYRCWRKADNDELAYLGTYLMLFAFGRDWRNATDSTRRVEGAIQMYVRPRPYLFFPDTGNARREEEYGRKIGENLASLSDFMQHLARQTGASSMKIYMEDTCYIPLNAHLAYYSDPQALQEDLRFISEIWEHGLPDYSTGALKNGNASDLDYAIYQSRDTEQGDRLVQELKALLPVRAMPTAEDIRHVLQSKSHGHYYDDGSFVVMDAPYYMNSMKDQFYIDVMKQAAGISRDAQTA